MGRKSLPTDEMNLTKREHKILDYMKQNIINKGYPPTVREICEFLDVKSTSTIHKDLSALTLKGFIRRDPAKPRAIEIIGFDFINPAGDISGTGANSDFSEASAPAPKSDRIFSDDSVSAASDMEMTERAEVVDIPLIGQVAAGMPILAEQNVAEYFPVPAKYVNNNGTHFMLTVKGESMIEAGIFDGDYILVRSQNTAVNGDMVVAMVDGFESEATVKTFFKENGHIRLQPENSTMSPIIVQDAKILGIVKGVFRYFN